MDSDFEKVIGAFFKRKGAQYASTLDSVCDAHDGSAGDTISRAAVWKDLEEALRSYSRRTLSDYVELLTVFGELSSPEEKLSLFEAHVDTTSDQILKRIASRGNADRKRAQNYLRRVKADVRAQFAEAVAVLNTGEKAPRDSAVELDDRLPLGRRAAFDRDFPQTVEESRRSGEPCALAMVDIDHFKHVNDQHGHPVGDEVLMEVARRVVGRVCRKGRAYRYGGEEFAIVLDGYSAQEAWGLAERIRIDIEREPVGGKALEITASFGVASIPDEASGAKELLKRADAALYQAKRHGRNQVRIATLSS